MLAEELEQTDSRYDAAVQFEAREQGTEERRGWQDHSDPGVNCSSFGNCIPFILLLHFFGNL